jgi:DNA-binding response OmpR family regulator
MKHILVVDDEPRFSRLVEANLTSEGYQVSSGSNGKQAVEMVAENAPDLILMDVMMPEYDGLEACLRIRNFSNVPIIMLTAKGQEEDKVQGLNSGADDYIVKPFSANELIARVKAVLRRSEIRNSELQESHLIIGEIDIDLAQALVHVRGEKVSFSATEYRLLLQLARNAGVVQSTEDLLTGVWGENYTQEKEILWVSISRLRQKLEINPKQSKIILTRSGKGYLMANNDEEAR